jgi:hypothetical protein
MYSGFRGLVPSYWLNENPMNVRNPRMADCHYITTASMDYGNEPWAIDMDFWLNLTPRPRHPIGVRLRNWQLAIDVLTIDVFWFKAMVFSRRSNEYLKNV